ncbi:hypothetical protein [Paeniglutamicibacter gangotriensis]|uniref:Uncharacterized protein n=1 Tax=Paeniglutamicibacter gangotriensis Lz1y TaxID=1276920 RepID=M7MNP1_9MICC|nr:hypothetical protein [Paeniglutamicibacter gangotriensis]EMQ96656.1 hypothetical protein ADIAG_03982 [Paeniglutamicibacter gangotriensis Lz1y]
MLLGIFQVSYLEVLYLQLVHVAAHGGDNSFLCLVSNWAGGLAGAVRVQLIVCGFHDQH